MSEIQQIKDMESSFDDIRSYHDSEVASTIGRLLADPEFKRVMKFIMPDMDWDVFETVMKRFHNKKDFQRSMVRDFVRKLVGKSSVFMEASGFDNLSKGQAYTFISNHRDIILDPSILCVLMLDAGFDDTPEIAIGDNLLLQPWIHDVVRLNKSFLVKRGVSVRQMLEVSMHLSQYIHYTVKEKKQSLWIAQREGRAKNSDDRTQESLLKMLSLGGGKDFLKSIRELNIVPVSLSYEYDPCDYLKAREFQLKRDNPEFRKSPQDDMVNMETGLFGFKGRIHFQIGRPINPMLSQIIDKEMDKTAIVSAVAGIIDKEIFRNYCFYPVNYIAYDKLWEEGKRFSAHYNEPDIKDFDTYMQKRLALIDLPDKDIPFLSEKLMEMYAYPVKNYLSVEQS